MTEPSTTAQAPTATPSSLAGESAPAGHKPLTAKQQAVYDLKLEGKTMKEIAAIRGISAPVVNKTLVVAYKKLGLSKKQRPPQAKGAEIRNPELAAAALEAASDPWSESRRKAIERVNSQLKELGIPDKVSEALVKRLKVKYAGAVYAAKELRTAEILEMLGRKIDLCAFYLDDKVLSEASARDIMLGMTALVEKRNLLRGEATVIVSDLERKKLHEMMPLLIAEGQRRGITIEGTATVVEEKK